VKRLLIFSTEFRPGVGGLGTHAYQLAKNFHAIGWEVCVLTNQNYVSDSEIETFNQEQPFQIVRMKAVPGSLFEGIYRAFKLCQVIRKWKPSVAMTTGNRSTWLGMVVFKLCGVLWMAVGHGGEFGVSTPLEKFLTRISYGSADGIVAVSRYTEGRMQALGIKSKRKKVILNGADEERFFVLKDFDKKKFLQDQGLGSAQYVFLTVGSVTERKGQEIGIRAMPQILKKFPGAHYAMAGFPKEKERYEQIARDLGVSDHVHFLGALDQVALLRWLNAADCFLLLSRTSADGDFEGYGIAVIEAGLCRKPSVVSSNGGLPEAVIEGQTGLVVVENDPAAAAEAILKLLENPEKMRAMGEYALECAKVQTWKKVVREYETFLLAMGSPS
jgi:phosphatidylinositol alpha-1,6-mannosyltransferase